MSEIKTAVLADRGVVSVSGLEAGKFLHGLITNDMTLLARSGDAIHAGLLTPQGKILSAFFVVRTADGYLLEVARDEAPGLAKRLSFYRLRTAVQIEDVSAQWRVAVRWRPDAAAVPAACGPGGISFCDARHSGLGWRVLEPAASPATAGESGVADYHRHRIGLAVPEAGLDYDPGDAFPHEANFDLLHGVDFDKGCFIGQEVVARMQHKTVVRKRIVRVKASVDLPAGRPDVTAGAATIGRLGSVSGGSGLALIRLDRAIEMLDKAEAIRADGVELTIDDDAIRVYRSAMAGRLEAS